MDISIRTNSGAVLITPWSAPGMSNDAFAARQAADAHKAAVAGAVAKAEDTPVFKSANDSKNFIRQQIEGIRQRLTVLRKLFAGDAKGMAHALTQIFKELRAALKAYKAAGGSEFGAADGMAAEVTSPPPAAADKASTDATGDQPGDRAADPAPHDDAQTEPVAGNATSDAQPDPVTAKTAAATYAEVDQGLRESVGSDGMTFLREVRAMVNMIEDKMLAPARIQHAAQKPDKATDAAFKAVETELKAVRKDMEDMRTDISRDAPTLGIHLTVA